MLSCEYLIIGSGKTGLTVAKKLAEAGKRIILIEQDRIGGSHLHETNFPQHHISNIAEKFGDSLDIFKDDKNTFKALVEYRSKISDDIKNKIKQEEKRIKQDLRDIENIEFISGQAEFTSPSLVEVNSKDDRHLIEFSTCILAVGKSLEELDQDIDIDKKVNILTEEEIYTLSQIPKKLGLVGLTVENIEIAHIYSDLGIEVEIYEKKTKQECLSNIDRSATNYTLKQLLIKQTNIHFNWNVKSISSLRNNITLVNQEGEKVKVSDIYLSMNKQLDFEYLGLEKISAKFNKHGIQTNSYGKVRCKSGKQIIALGECNAGVTKLNKADILNNFLIHEKIQQSPKKSVVTKSHLSNIKTDIINIKSKYPVATIGISENLAVAKYGSQIKHTIVFDQQKEGFCKIIYKDSNKEVLGVVVAGEFFAAFKSVAITHVQDGHDYRKMLYFVHAFLGLE